MFSQTRAQCHLNLTGAFTSVSLVCGYSQLRFEPLHSRSPMYFTIIHVTREYMYTMYSSACMLLTNGARSPSMQRVKRCFLSCPMVVRHWQIFKKISAISLYLFTIFLLISPNRHSSILSKIYTLQLSKLTFKNFASR